MGLIASAKGEAVKAFLGKLTEGDAGSTALGAVALAVIGSGVNFSDLFSPDQAKQGHALGIVGAAVVLGLWGYFIGKKKKKQ